MTTNNPLKPIVIEAEDLNFDDDFVVSTIDPNASGGKILRVRSNRIDGDARTTFNGPAGTYTLTLFAYDENDGAGGFRVFVNGQVVNNTTLNRNLGSRVPNSQTRVQINIEDLALTPGDNIRIEARRGGAEFTSLDKIVFTPIAPANVAITSNGGGDSAVVNINEGTTAVTDVDVNVGDQNVTYQINAGADRNLFNIDPITGQLSFKSAPDWERPQDADGNNVYEVNVVANGAGSGDGQFLSVVVNDVDETPKPIEIEAEALNFDNDFFVSNIDPNASGGKIIRVRSNRIDGDARTTFSGPSGNYTLTLTAYDENDGAGGFRVFVNGQVVNNTTLNKNLGSRVPNGQTRVEIDIENLALKTGDNIRIEARRGGAELTSLDKITFTPVAAPSPDVVITSNGGGDFAVVNIDENTQAVTDLEVNVGDENVVYQITDGADKDLFEIDSATGQLSFKDAPDWENPQDVGRDNVYEVNVVAAGANSGDGQFFSVVVNDVEESGPPQAALTILNSAPGVLVQEGKRYVTDINVNDAEDGGILYQINAGADANLFNIDARTGVLSFKQTPDWENPTDQGGNGATAGDNNYEVNVLAIRGNEATSKFLTVTVADIADETAAPVSVYLLAGQSNLVGEAEIANLSDPGFVQPFPQTQIWNRFGSSFVDLNPDFEGPSAFLGPELSFGRRAAALSTQDVYIVKYGLGGTSLAVDWNPDNTGPQYRTFVNTVDSALQTLTQNGIAYELDGLVWQQGESDTFDDSFAPEYQDNLTQFLGRVRELYGEDLDVSIGLVRNDLPTSRANLDLVRAAQTAVANADPNAVLLDTDALGSSAAVMRLAQNDLTHYNADGQIALGFAHAEALLG